MNKARIKDRVLTSHDFDENITNLDNDSSLFDLKNINDIPEKVSKHIGKKSQKMTVFKGVRGLFDIKQPLSVDELVVGLWRKYGIEATRSYIVYVLHHLKNKNMVERTPNGVYKKCNDDRWGY